MARIRRLPPILVNKIAAGEVVERPASVVKELVENAIDAGARRLDVTVAGGGSRLIRVSDDGEGIAAEDLPLAVSSHATSKLRSAEDLFRITSLGFRGEALASIAAVSHLRLTSRAAGEARGAEVRVDGGRMGPVQAVGAPSGTSVEVADLFFNVPARRAFLRTERAELRAILNELKRQALARPDVHLRVEDDEGKALLEAPSTAEPRERAAQLLGRELAADLLAVPATSGEEGLGLRGYITPCDRSRGDSQQQYFFLNGRAIRDVTLLTAVKQAYANLLPPRRHPTALLWLELDPARVDVNVHPQKAEVRFSEDRQVFRLVVRALQTALREGGLVAELRLPRHTAGEAGLGPAHRLSGASDHGAAGVGSAVAAPPRSVLTPGLPGAWSGGPGGEGAAGDHAGGGSGGGGGAVAPAAPGVGRFMQIHRRYVVEETERGLRLVDPHALHERILYEEIVARLAEEPLESQRFLFPQVLDAAADELLAAADRSELLALLGFEVAPFGRTALAVHAAPRLLAAERVGDTVRDLLREGAAGGSEEERGGLLHDLAASLACRSAVRFGDALPDAQIEALLARRAAVPRGHACPHGRPTAMALSLDELDRRFGRQGARPGE